MEIIDAATPEHIAAARDLFRAYAASLPFDLEFQGFREELAGLPGAYAPPGGCLLLACDPGAFVGTVALKPLAPGIAEIKRLYVAPEWRGRALGRQLLERVIAEAEVRQYRRVRLDSHRASMRAAIALYLRLGFVEIAPYGPDLDGALGFFEKRLGV